MFTQCSFFPSKNFSFSGAADVARKRAAVTFLISEYRVNAWKNQGNVCFAERVKGATDHENNLENSLVYFVYIYSASM